MPTTYPPMYFNYISKISKKDKIAHHKKPFLKRAKIFITRHIVFKKFKLNLLAHKF